MTALARHGQRALLEVVVFVAIWMGAGWLLELDANSYLLLGVPLTLLFQVLIRRRPISEAWISRSARRSPLTRWLPFAVLLLAGPLLSFVQALQAEVSIIVLLWGMAALVGAFPAAYSIVLLRRDDLGILGLCVAASCLVVSLYFLGADAAPASPWLSWIRWTLLYFPMSFALEEVTFRGVLDSHVARSQPGKVSALLVGALWGIWHLPLVAHGTAVQVLVQASGLVVTHLVPGAILAYGWRKTGNLAVPALAHALMSAGRNAWSL